MKTVLETGGSLGGVVAFLLCMFVSVASAEEPIIIEIDVSPNILNLESAATCMTVHTDIAYGSVDCESVTLNYVPADYCKSDSLGFFVAKFDIDQIKALDLVEGQNNTFTLTGFTVDYEMITGKQDIKVINIVPAGLL